MTSPHIFNPEKKIMINILLEGYGHVGIMGGFTSYGITDRIMDRFKKFELYDRLSASKIKEKT